MAKATVYILKGQNAYSTTKKILKSLNLGYDGLKDKRILIKPNAGRHVMPNLGINTNPEVIAAIIDFLLDGGIRNIIIGESPILGVKALESLKKCGISDVAVKRKIPLIDLDKLEPVKVKIPNGKVIKQLRICKEVMMADYIISVPVMKTHMHTQVSLGLKNMKGCLYKREKVKLHQLPFSKQITPPAKPLDQAIADMAKVLLPDLTIIDGTTGQEGLGPSAGNPVNANLIIASENCLAADWTGAELMGLNPNKIQHLKLTIGDLKSINQDYQISNRNIKIVPSDYSKWITPFQVPPDKISLEYSNVKIDDKDSCSACLSTLMMFLKRYYHEYADYFSEKDPLKIALGKSIGKQPENTFLIGNCAIHQKEGCIFVKGCPPVASQIKKEVDKMLAS